MQTETQESRQEPPATGRLRGNIERIVNKAGGKGGGFGFIRAEDGQDYFLHIKNMRPRNAFIVGTIVEFTPVPPLKPHHNPGAVKVEVVA